MSDLTIAKIRGPVKLGFGVQVVRLKRAMIAQATPIIVCVGTATGYLAYLRTANKRSD
jgi:hypothetical protein